MSQSSIVSSQQQVPCRGASSVGKEETPQADMLLRHFIFRLVVAGVSHHFLFRRFVQFVAWIRSFRVITRITPELENAVGSSAMLRLRMHELQLL